MNPFAAVGLAIMIGSEGATLARVEPFWSWNTPIAWTGFILFSDAVVYRARGRSWLRTSPKEFVFLALASIPLWLVFEFYNRFIENWYYVGLPANRALRLFGYGWSFATIWPAIFEGAALVGIWRGLPDPPDPPSLPDSPALPGPPDLSRHRYWTIRRGSERQAAAASVIIGALFLIWPLLWPSRYLAAPVWLGFIFLLEPINFRLGGESLWRDFTEGHFDRFKNLLLSGILCGVLWEFWNYWSRAKWHYTVPIMEHLKIFEMPLPGYLGFPPFALECFTMYVVLRTVLSRAIAPYTGRTPTDRAGTAGSSGYPVGLS